MLCKQSQDETIIITTTNEGTHNLELEEEISKCLRTKRIALVLVLYPWTGDDDSLKAYKRLTEDVVELKKNGDHADIDLSLIEDKITRIAKKTC